MRRMIEKILSYYAGECSVETADGVQTVRAFIEPVRNTGKDDFLRQMHELGQIPEGRFVYIGPVTALPKEDGSVRQGDRAFTACRMETLYAGKEPVYIWGLLREWGNAVAESD